jgi:type II secretory pathway pseudopilin PulG
MRRIVRDQSGITLVELQVVLVLMLVILGATLTTFNQSEANWRVNQEHTDALDQTRRAVDGVARQLRNLASPSTENPTAVERMGAYDIVFQTVASTKPDGSSNDRNITRVRYCVGEPADGVSTLWRQQETWTSPSSPPDVPEGAACPATSWPALGDGAVNATVVAENLANAEQAVPLFSYGSDESASVYSIGVDVLVDADPDSSPAATRLGTSVFLRNQNQAPVSHATATDTGTGHRVVLNGSGSFDPEGRSLALYEWFADGDLDDPIATGVVAQWEPPGTSWPQTYDITLRVTDVGGRAGETTLEGVTVN